MAVQVNGDFLVATTLSTLTKGAHMIDLFNTMHVDMVVLGNHEFDFGPDQLKQRISGMCAVLCCCVVLYFFAFVACEVLCLRVWEDSCCLVIYSMYARARVCGVWLVESKFLWFGSNVIEADGSIFKGAHFTKVIEVKYTNNSHVSMFVHGMRVCVWLVCVWCVAGG